jgi:predicted membrane protein
MAWPVVRTLATGGSNHQLPPLLVKSPAEMPIENLSQMLSPWCWNIYLQNWAIIGWNVGQYSSTMVIASGYIVWGMNIWVNYNISLTWIKAIWGYFLLLTMIPVRSQWGRYNLPRNIRLLAKFHLKMFWAGWFPTISSPFRLTLNALFFVP